MELIVRGDADAGLTIVHAERAAELDLIAEVMVTNELLKRLHDLAGSFDMARRTDTYSNFHHKINTPCILPDSERGRRSPCGRRQTLGKIIDSQRKMKTAGEPIQVQSLFTNIL